MPLYRVTISKPKPKWKNPFLQLRVPERDDKHEVIAREWEFEAKDEDEVRKLFWEAKDHPNVKGFELRSIKKLRD